MSTAAAAATTTAARPAVEDVPLPDGFRVTPGADATEVEPGVWFGGQPARVLRLSAAGRQAWADLRSGAPVAGRVSGLVARRFVAVGMAHPVPPVPPVGDGVPSLTVVVPVHDRPAELDRSLAALGGVHPVVVVDDASPDAAAVRRVAARHGARVVRLAVNGGPGAARNAGLAAVATELVALVDSDTEATPAALHELAAQLADPLTAAAAPRIRAESGASASARYSRARGSLDLGPEPARVAPYTPVSYVPTAVLVARTEALRDVARAGHVFDPALRYGEDVDLVWRLLADGGQVRYCPATTVTHHDPHTWRGLLARRFRYGTSAAPLARKHPRNLAPLVVHPWYTTAVVALLARRPMTAVGAAAGALVATRRTVAAAGLPATAVRPAHVVRGVGQTGLGVARYAVQFAAPALLLATTRRRTRTSALALLLAPALTEWRRRRPELDPVRFAAAAVADDCAYGAGVVAGCVRHRTITPLLPVRARPVPTRRRST
ncbi:mycofactocin system glycosyltransferase [Jatrophihabitans endophyticus]|uniref:Mycofactocin system glycosyltransferase n=1 Tax=Jatrophihabitans endophyticus TaxID=1206085 RepID=A0A1M5Q1T9_9ACTN|nr:mycofactocin biosynthesis glycosyltransferase MftF [Jatrophihabitans endophyticus]SHH07912.1 mycofactocin system glycosyltransferase [Jatrophihabitans endophyticus]